MINKKSFFGTWNHKNKTFWIDRVTEAIEKGCEEPLLEAAMIKDDKVLKFSNVSGIPAWLVDLISTTYHYMSDDKNSFLIDVLTSIPESTKLNFYNNKTCLKRLVHLKENFKELSCLDGVIEIHRKAANGDIIDLDDECVEFAHFQSHKYSAKGNFQFSFAASAASDSLMPNYSSNSSSAKMAVRSIVFSSPIEIREKINQKEWKEEAARIIAAFND